MAVDFSTIKWENGYESTLDDRVILSDNYIRMTPVPQGDIGYLVLEDTSRDNFEVILYTSKDAGGVYIGTNGQRNMDNTSTGVHPRGARVRGNITAQAIRAMQGAVDGVSKGYVSRTADIADKVVTGPKINTQSLADYSPFGVLTYNIFGSGGGQILTTGAVRVFGLTTLETNNSSIITKPTDGVLQVSEAGWYEVSLNHNVSDGGGTITYTTSIQASNGSGFVLISPFIRDITSANGRGGNQTAVYFLQPSGQVRAVTSIGSSQLRFGSSAALEKYNMSLWIKRIG